MGEPGGMDRIAFSRDRRRGISKWWRSLWNSEWSMWVPVSGGGEDWEECGQTWLESLDLSPWGLECLVEVLMLQAGSGKLETGCVRERERERVCVCVCVCMCM